MNELLSVDDLISVIKQYNPGTKADLIKRAYYFGLAAHAGQIRKSCVSKKTKILLKSPILTRSASNI